MQIVSDSNQKAAEANDDVLDIDDISDGDDNAFAQPV